MTGPRSSHGSRRRATASRSRLHTAAPCARCRHHLQPRSRSTAAAAAAEDADDCDDHLFDRASDRAGHQLMLELGATTIRRAEGARTNTTIEPTGQRANSPRLPYRPIAL